MLLRNIANVNRAKMNGNSVFAVPSSSRGHPCASNSRPDTLVAGNRIFANDGAANLWSPCSDCSSSDDNNSPTAINTINWDKPALEDKTLNFGWSAANKSDRRTSHRCKTTPKPSGYANVQSERAKDPVRPSPNKEKRNKSSSDGGSNPPDPGSTLSLEERLRIPADSSEGDDLQDSECYDSMRSDEEIQKERKELRNVAWFQAGIPREIALEVLAEKPEGSFIVRESTTKLGCYALSLRVPQSKNPSGIAHYLILHTSKGYKIKGFTKEFSSLKALIIHHSVMPELLPCPLALSRHSTRDAEQEFEETEQKTCDIFADIHWLMTDLEV